MFIWAITHCTVEQSMSLLCTYVVHTLYFWIEHELAGHICQKVHRASPILRYSTDPPCRVNSQPRLVGQQPACLGAVPGLNLVHTLHLLLQLKKTVHESLRCWRAARYVDVNRDNSITASDNGV